jgi:hypothetical protein
MNNLKMYMVTHKNIDYIPKGRIPIFVGKGDNSGSYMTDDSGENISEKNRNYCELTALYWIWKNDHESEYVSIEHYRRFFMNAKSIIPAIAEPEEIKKIMKTYDVITSRYYDFGISIKEYYKQRHYLSDIEAAQEGIRKYYPEYLEAFDLVFDGKRIPMFNMLVMPKKLFDEYCEWLFKILFFAEETIDLSNRTEYQKRAYGFMAERLLEVWLTYKNLKVKRNPIYIVDSNKLRSVLVSAKNRIPTVFTPKTPRR